MGKPTDKESKPEGQQSTAEAPKTAGVKRRRRNRHGKNQEKASEEDTLQYTGNRLEVSFLEQATTGAEEEGILPGAFVAPLDPDFPPTDDNVSFQNGDWKQLCRIWNKLSSRKGGNTGWTSPTPIQLQSWPILLSTPSSGSSSNNLITLAPTGSGKTLAYGIPLVLAAIRSINSEDERPRLAGLVLVPTRELALQVAAEVTTAAKAVSKKHAQQAVVVSCHGGVDRQQQVNAMLQVQASDGLIVTATPGRLLDLLQPTLASSTSEASLKIALASAEQLCVRFSRVEYTVLDEADRLAVSADLYQQIDAILAVCTSRQTTCLVSATWPDKVKEKWNEWLGPGPCAVVKVNAMTLTKATNASTAAATTAATDETVPANDDTTVSEPVASQDQPSANRTNDWMTKIPAHLTQTLHVCSEHKKPRKLVVTLEKIRKESTYSRQQQLGIIFFSKIKTLQYVSKLLINDNIPCQELHSHLPQAVREQSVQRFQCGQVPLLLATDIAARGIHVNNIHFVINYDFPGNLEQYVHRCGRAGRGVGAESAHVFSFFTRNMAPMAADVIRLLEANQQWVDQNLRDLAVTPADQPPGPGGGGMSKRQRRKELGAQREEEAKEQGTGREKDTKERVQEDADTNPDDDYEAPSDAEDWNLQDDFLENLGKRIVLKRADNVSDASVSDDDNE